MDLTARLEAARRIIEEKFLTAGEILTQSIQGIETLISALERLAAALSSDGVEATIDELRAAAEKLNALPANHQARMDRFTRLKASRDGLIMPLAEMRTSLAYMRAFTVNIKIVAGGLGELGSEFGLFADDISQCIEKGEAELKQLDADSEALRERVEKALIQGAALGREIHAALPALPQELARCADETGAHYRNVATTVASVTDLAKDIRNKVANILAALQIGDITRQRIEHIQTGAALVTSVAGPEPEDRRRRIGALIYTLLANQLAATAEDFRNDVVRIETSMSAMATDARKILELHGAIYGNDEKGGFLHTLGHSIDQARALVGNIEQTDQAAIETGKETADAAQKLNLSILDVQLLKNDVQYMALNTTIKCCQIGDIGLPLSVIALELRDHGSELENAAENGLSVLGALAQEAAVLAEDTHAEETGGGSKAAAEALFETSQRIRHAAEKNDRDIASIAEKGDEVQSTLEQSSQRLRFRDDIGDTLDAATAALKAQGADIAPCAGDIAAPVGKILDELAKSYTMAQERSVHQAFAETFAAAALAQDTADTADTVGTTPAEDADDYADVLF